MKKLLLIVCCIFISLSLYGCKSNTKEFELIEIAPGIYIQGGIEKRFDADPEKTPLIHEAIEIYYDRNYKESREKLISALDKGEFDPIAYYFLGYMYAIGLGVEIDNDIAFDYFTKGAEYNQPNCVYDLGVMYELRGKTEESNELNEKAIELGAAMAYYPLVSHNMQNKPAISKENTDKAVKTNDADVIYRIGRIYYAYDEDREKTFELYNIAANLGLAEAICELGYCYEIGYGTEKNLSKAFEYYLKAAETYQFSDYYNKVGYCYENGIGVEADAKKAEKYYKMSTEDGNGEGWSNLGYMYEVGTIVEHDYDKALEYYTKSYNSPLPSEEGLSRYDRLKHNMELFGKLNAK